MAKRDNGIQNLYNLPDVLATTTVCVACGRPNPGMKGGTCSSSCRDTLKYGKKIRPHTYTKTCERCKAEFPTDRKVTRFCTACVPHIPKYLAEQRKKHREAKEKKQHEEI